MNCSTVTAYCVAIVLRSSMTGEYFRDDRNITGRASFAIKWQFQGREVGLYADFFDDIKCLFFFAGRFNIEYQH